MKGRTLIWCWIVNHPCIVHFPDDVPACSLCGEELYTGDVTHTEMYVVTKPEHRPPIDLDRDD